MVTDPHFRVLNVATAGRVDLARLVTQTAACVHQPGFLDAGLSATLAAVAGAMPLESVDQVRVNPPVLRFGPTLNDHVVEGRLQPEYWEHVERARTAWVRAGLPADPLRTCMEKIGTAWGAPVSPARIGGREVLAGTIRESNGGLRVHFDDVAREFPRGLFDQPLLAQLAMNVYLSMPSRGGQTTIWRRTWEPADEGARIGFGYDRCVVEGLQSVVVRPRTGDALIFNPRFFHAVAAGEGGPRISVAMFLGITVDGHLTVWS